MCTFLPTTATGWKPKCSSYISYIKYQTSAGRVPDKPTLGYGYIGTRTDTTQQPGQTPDKEVEIKHITDYVSGYTETDTTGMLSPPTIWRFSVAAGE